MGTNALDLAIAKLDRKPKVEGRNKVLNVNVPTPSLASLQIIAIYRSQTQSFEVQAHLCLSPVLSKHCCRLQLTILSELYELGHGSSLRLAVSSAGSSHLGHFPYTGARCSQTSSRVCCCCFGSQIIKRMALAADDRR